MGEVTLRCVEEEGEKSERSMTSWKIPILLIGRYYLFISCTSVSRLISYAFAMAISLVGCFQIEIFKTFLLPEIAILVGRHIPTHPLSPFNIIRSLANGID